MKNRTSETATFEGFIGKILTRLHGFGLRIAVHFLALCAAGFAMFAKPVPGAGKGIVFLSTYIGLVCLFSRGMTMKASWLVPFGSGLVQCAVLLALGSHFHLALFFGGLQTWLLRIIQKKGENGTEWFAVFFLVIGAASLVDSGNALRIVSSFLPIALAGIFIGRRFKTENFQLTYGKKLQKSVKQIEDASFSMKIPLQIRQQSEELLKRVKPVEPYLSKDSADTREVIDTLFDAAENLSALLHSDHSEGTFGPAEKKTRMALEEALSRLNDFIESMPGANSRSAAESEEEKIRRDALLKTRPFRENAAELIRKKEKLPADLHAPVEGIHRSALAIIECMVTDPKDMAPGTRFLERYLPAAHKVADEYVRLTREGPASSELEKALNLSTELLARLEKAFGDEYAALMKNDVLHFTAELKVLDSLLKMEGR